MKHTKSIINIAIVSMLTLSGPSMANDVAKYDNWTLAEDGDTITVRTFDQKEQVIFGYACSLSTDAGHFYVTTGTSDGLGRKLDGKMTHGKAQVDASKLYDVKVRGLSDEPTTGSITSNTDAGELGVKVLHGNTLRMQIPIGHKPVYLEWSLKGSNRGVSAAMAVCEEGKKRSFVEPDAKIRGFKKISGKPTSF